MTFCYSGQLKLHRGAITSIVCPSDISSAVKLVTASRDHTVAVWTVATERGSATPDDRRSEASSTSGPTLFPLPVVLRKLEGHSNFVQDVALTNNADYALTASWDRSLRLWNLRDGSCCMKFIGHTHDLLTCAVSPDNRYIVSGCRDGSIKVWNVKGECVHTLTKAENGHTDWVTCVRFGPDTSSPLLFSASWDRSIKVWDLQSLQCRTLLGHKGYITSFAISPDGSILVSGAKDGLLIVWEVVTGVQILQLEAGCPVHQVVFSPTRYWICAATESAIKVWNLETKSLVADLIPQAQKKTVKPECSAIAWSADGRTLYSGFTDNTVRIWTVPVDVCN